MKKEKFAELINSFDFSELFNQFGWNNFTDTKTISVDNKQFVFTGIKEKKNFGVFVCNAGEKLPDYATRKQLETKLSPLYFDHLIIFVNATNTEQLWQLPIHEQKKTVRLVHVHWYKGQTVDNLFQRLRNIVFSLEEEDSITLLDVKERINKNFATNSEQVTKKFYAEFTKQHHAFLAFIKGIDDKIPDKDNENKKWYASLMLNRLMFCYFIQKKGFLDNDTNYLQNKLQACKLVTGNNKFYGFYRSFLLEFFHDELANPPESRKKEMPLVPFGNIPYLNGGLFDLHELEKQFTIIEIKDNAFENIFNFFDQWNWTLDTRADSSGKDINPDVLGYIFEKYINDRAAMGAYYTKEDITDYIGKNTIIPFLLEKVKSWSSAPFEKDGSFWKYLQDSKTEFIYDAVKYGIPDNAASIDDINIPENIRVGIDTKSKNLLERRKDWNTATPEELGLPTEIWRETISRFQHYFEIRNKIINGEICGVNDLITYNLNIRHLVEEYLRQTASDDFIRKFWTALTQITILDPTCGSGAFLFAAMNILLPLYEVCIQRMEEAIRINPTGNTDFMQKLERINLTEQSNYKYVIFKTIILNNLYGVDLMKEAVEIAKLRLFLKLVAEVDPSPRKKNFGLEPLPDIDFNIRSGNTLVGFATEAQIEDAFKWDLNFAPDALQEIKTTSDIIAAKFSHFKTIQLNAHYSGETHHELKNDLRTQFAELNKDLNKYLAKTYAIDADSEKTSEKERYADWLTTHQPFHWFSEFYEIISKGGFDVVIGNPPYVEYKNGATGYKIQGYKTENCGNLYTFVMERCNYLLIKNGFSGMIVPHSSICTDRMEPVISETFAKRKYYVSSYDIRPSKLFDGVDQRLLIYIICNNIDNTTGFVSNYHRWNSEYRDYLFSTLEYIQSANMIIPNSIAKIHSNIELDIISKIIGSITFEKETLKTGENILYYHNAPRYFIRAQSFIPYFWNEKDGEKLSVQLKSFCFQSDQKRDIAITILSSTLFYWWFVIFSDCRHFNIREINLFPINFENVNIQNKSTLVALAQKLGDDLKSNSVRKECVYKATGKVIYDEFYPKRSKPIIDEIDKVLARHYGFTDEELDYIINYDIKYRMGGELSSCDEEGIA